jgi:hypothetical protein
MYMPFPLSQSKGAVAIGSWPVLLQTHMYALKGNYITHKIGT